MLFGNLRLETRVQMAWDESDFVRNGSRSQTACKGNTFSYVAFEAVWEVATCIPGPLLLRFSQTSPADHL